jgi:hypothetical protein
VDNTQVGIDTYYNNPMNTLTATASMTGSYTLQLVK